MELNEYQRERLQQIKAWMLEASESALENDDPVYAADVLDKACEEIDRLLDPLVAPEDQHGPTEFQM